MKIFSCCPGGGTGDGDQLSTYASNLPYLCINDCSCLLIHVMNALIHACDECIHTLMDALIDRWMDCLGQNRLQVCFFSATLHSPQIKQLADSICVNPTWVDLRGEMMMVMMMMIMVTMMKMMIMVTMMKMMMMVTMMKMMMMMIMVTMMMKMMMMMMGMVMTLRVLLHFIFRESSNDNP